MDKCPEEKRIKRNEDDIQGIWDKLELLMGKWIPVWVSIVMTAMGTVTGSALTVAFIALKYAGK